MPTVAELLVRIGAENGELKRKLKDSESSFKRFGKSVAAIAGGVGLAQLVSSTVRLGKESALLAGRAEGVRAAFEKLNRPGLLDELRRATLGTASDFELMKNTVQASNFQIPINQLAKLFEFATKRAAQTGESVDYLVNSIVLGIGRKSPLILDNLGISAVRLRETLKGAGVEMNTVGDIAAAVGKIAEEEVRKMGDVGLTTAQVYERLGAAWDNAKVTLGNFANAFARQVLPAVESIVSLFKSNADVYKENSSELTKLSSNTNKLVDRYKELKSKTELSKNEQTELKDVIRQLGDALPTVVTAFDDYGNAIDVNVDKVDAAIKAQRELLDLFQDNSIDKSSERIGTFKDRIEELNAELDRGGKTIYTQAGASIDKFFSKFSPEAIKERQQEIKKLNLEIVEQLRVQQQLGGNYIELQVQIDNILKQYGLFVDKNKLHREEMERTALATKENNKAIEESNEGFTRNISHLREVAEWTDIVAARIARLSEQYQLLFGVQVGNEEFLEQSNDAFISRIDQQIAKRAEQSEAEKLAAEQTKALSVAQQQAAGQIAASLIESGAQAIATAKNFQDAGRMILATLIQEVVALAMRNAFATLGPIGAVVATAIGGAASAAFTRATSSTPSFAVGTNYVPRDMTANIHKGEAIVPKRYNPAAGGVGFGGQTVIQITGLSGKVLNAILKQENNVIRYN